MLAPQGFAYPQTPTTVQPWDPSQPVRIRVITWNMGEIRLTIDQWKQELLTNWNFVTKRDFDLLCLCLQEDSRGKYGKLGDAMGSLLQSEFTMVSNSVEGPPEVTGQSFSVRAYIFARKTIFINPAIRKNDVCLKRTVYCTKGTAGVSLIVIIGGYNVQILLMSSHLPVSTTVEDFGYEERVQAVKKSMESVYDTLVQTPISKRIAFWAGDLNFREQTPVKAGGVPFDQLEYAKSVRPAKFWREFIEPEVAFPPTCKLAICKNKQCPVCRNKSDQAYNKECYIHESVTVLGKVKEYQPSHCDRIHFRADDVSGEVVEYRSWSESPVVGESDHNLVLATFSVVF